MNRVCHQSKNSSQRFPTAGGHPSTASPYCSCGHGPRLTTIPRLPSHRSKPLLLITVLAGYDRLALFIRACRLQSESSSDRTIAAPLFRPQAVQFSLLDFTARLTQRRLIFSEPAPPALFGRHNPTIEKLVHLFAQVPLVA